MRGKTFRFDYVKALPQQHPWKYRLRKQGNRWAVIAPAHLVSHNWRKKAEHALRWSIELENQKYLID